jgi:tRNA(fMet)-specific endonuclease VapC
MSMYLLDTSTISDFLSNTGRTQQKLQTISPSEVAISAITTMEVLYGFELKAVARRRYSARFQTLCAIVETIPFDQATASVAANIRASLKIKGQPIGSFDLLIGATALVHGCILVTSNLREFERIDGLNVENWR